MPKPLSALEQAAQQALAPAGELALCAEDFRVRDGQTAMALAIARTIEQGGTLVTEAGTGVGKTWAYLVPALLSGERMLLSTATKTLQDQLYGRDLPHLLKTFNLPMRAALLKGRASYLCLHRLELARQSPAGQVSGAVRTLARVETWAQQTTSGDLADLVGLDERSAVIPLITSTRENCLGSECPRFRACFVNSARRAAMAADVVVINHHLFFADLAVRESGMAELLPSTRVVVFDEAHRLNETGVQFLGTRLSTGQALDFARDMLAAGLQWAQGLADWQSLAALCERAAREMRLILEPQWTGAKLRWAGPHPEAVAAETWDKALHGLQRACTQALQALEHVADTAPDFDRLHARAQAMLDKLDTFTHACNPDHVRWVDVGSHHMRLVQSPLDIAPTMRTLVGQASACGGVHPPDTQNAPDDADTVPPAAPSPAEQRHHSWIFTSATLGDDERLRWFTEPCGLQDAHILRVQSPFDYARQATLYVPAHLPLPADPQHTRQLALWASSAIAALGGRTLFLTTTHKALQTAGEILRDQLASTSVEVLVQGQWPKRRLMERLREGGSAGEKGCVLVASASFWAGVDIPGDALQLLIIDKLPFPPPGDPMVEARLQRLEAAGRNSFQHFSLPEAAVVLKQGAGRLIRRETDTGILVIGDTRLLNMRYGKRLLAALPPMRRAGTEDEFRQALQTLLATPPPSAA